MVGLWVVVSKILVLFAYRDKFLKGHKMENTSKEVRGAVRIGRSGAKLHPAVIRDGKLWILCSCPGTRQGSTYKGARFLPGEQANCKNGGYITTKDV